MANWKITSFVSLLVFAVLTGCGGGGGDSPSSTASPPQTQLTPPVEDSSSSDASPPQTQPTQAPTQAPAPEVAVSRQEVGGDLRVALAQAKVGGLDEGSEDGGESVVVKLTEEDIHRLQGIVRTGANDRLTQEQIDVLEKVLKIYGEETQLCDSGIRVGDDGTCMKICADESQVAEGALCPVATKTCLDGSSVPLTENCMKSCGGGIEVVESASCPVAMKTCLDGGQIPESETCMKRCGDRSKVAESASCPVAMQTCLDERVIPASETCMKRCKNGSEVAESGTCMKTCEDRSVIAESAVCPFICESGSVEDLSGLCELALRRCLNGDVVAGREICTKICSDGAEVAEGAICPVAMKTCKDDREIPATETCMKRCENGSEVAETEVCQKECAGGKVIAETAACPVAMQGCFDGSSVPLTESCMKSCGGGIKVVESEACPVAMQMCLNGDVIPASEICMKRCWNGNEVAESGSCTKICEDGSTVAQTGLCPVAMKTCKDDREIPATEDCTKLCNNGDRVVESAVCEKRCDDGSMIAELDACPVAMQTCLDDREIPVTEVCTKLCNNGDSVAESATCTKLCENGDRIAESAVCPVAMQACQDGNVIPATEICTKLCKNGDKIAESAVCPVAMQTCLDDREIPATEICTKLCENGDRIAESAVCSVAMQTCQDGISIPATETCTKLCENGNRIVESAVCPVAMQTCQDGREIPASDICPKVCENEGVISAPSACISAPAASDGKNYRDRYDFKKDYGLANINADAAYQRGYFGQGVTVAVIDSGMLVTHDSLSGNVVPGANFSAGAPIDAPITDVPSTHWNLHGYGTFIGGIIAGNLGRQGVAPRARLMPLQIGNTKHGFDGRLDGDMRAALRYAVQQDVPVVNNGSDLVHKLVGRYQGEQYAVEVPFLPAFWGDKERATAQGIADDVGDSDTIFVWGAGDTGWNSHGETRLCGSIDKRLTDGHRSINLCTSWRDEWITIRPSQLINGFDSESYVDEGWVSPVTGVTLKGFGKYVRGNPEGLIRVTLDVPDVKGYGDLSALNLDSSSAGFYGLLPVYHPELEDNWLVAVAVGQHNHITHFSNGCGAARFWCLAAPGEDIYGPVANYFNHGFLGGPSGGHYDFNGNGYRHESSTSFAAAHVSGALAVLRSRLPDMPMSVLRAILLTTATDLGAPGVDADYGWGLLNLGKAITVQGNVVLARLSDSIPVAPEPDALPADGVFVLPEPDESDGNDYRDGNFEKDYGLGNINADAAYQRGYFGQGVTVAVIDTGMLTSHESLADNVISGANFINRGLHVFSHFDIAEPITDSLHPYWNSFGHGTFVAGIIAGNPVGANGRLGVAPRARLLPLQLGSDGRLHNIPSALQYAARQNVQVVNNSYLFADGGYFHSNGGIPHKLVGSYEGEQYVATVPYLPSFWSYSGGVPEDSLEFAAELGKSDTIFVWKSGDSGWHTGGEVQLCRDINLGLADICPDDMKRTVTPTELINGFDSGTSRTSRFTVTVAESGRSVIINFNSFVSGVGKLSTLSSDTSYLDYRDDSLTATIDLTPSSTDFLGLLPVYYPELEDNWLVAVATDEDNNIAPFSNGCGLARFWCLAAPGVNIYSSTAHGTDTYSVRSGTAFAAAHISGALAALKSRLPDMPMSVVRAILLTTATDLGEPGVDVDYGWGLVNLAKAITLQGEVRIASLDTTTESTSDDKALLLKDTRIQLPASLAGIRDALADIPVAVLAVGGAYYNTPLSGLVDVAPSAASDLGDAAADMLSSSERVGMGSFFAGMAPGSSQFHYAGADISVRALGALGTWRIHHRFCEDCDESVWRDYGDEDFAMTPFFASERSAFMLEGRGDGLRPFVALSGKAHGRDELPYRQIGARWTERTERLSWSAELSRIEESASFLGADFGDLGKAQARTHQGRVQLRGDLSGDWRGFAIYERALSEAKVEGDGFLRELGNLHGDGWSFGLEGDNVLRGGDRLRFSVGRRTALRSGHAMIRHVRARCSDGSDGYCFSKAFDGGLGHQELVTETTRVELSAEALTTFALGYAVRPSSDSEFALGMEYEAESKDSALSLQLRVAF